VVPAPAAPACAPPAGAIVDSTVRAQPKVVLPPKGGTYTDPTFGTTILRVTDATDGRSGSYHAYTYWPVFNAGSTRFQINKGGQPTLYAFDPATLKMSQTGPLFGGATCNWEDAIWSHTDPDVIYCHTVTPKRLYSYNVTQPGQLTLIHDFEADLPAASDARMWQMLDDGADDVFTFHTRDAANATHHAVVYVRSTGAVQTRDYTGQGMDETNVDRSGRWIVVWVGGRWDVWDLTTGVVAPVQQNPVERGGLCHQAAGTDLYAGGDCWQSGYLARPLDDPLGWTHLATFFRVDGTLDWGFVTHASLNQPDERWFASSIFDSTRRESAVWDPYEQEIVAVAVDGSWVRRLAHHHSIVGNDYWSEPRASVSYDGRFVTFTSNFDGKRKDVFVLVLPQMCQ
jgi:hypothetical protein